MSLNIFFYFFLIINSIFEIKINCCCIKNKNKNKNKKINFNSELNENNDKNNKEKDLDKKKEEEKLNNNNNTEFYHDNKNCVFQTTINSLMIIFDHFPELFEEFKKEENIITNTDKVDIKYKKAIINEIIELRKKYLNGEKQIKIFKLYDLIVDFVVQYFKTHDLEFYYKNKENYIKFQNIYIQNLRSDCLKYFNFNEIQIFIYKNKNNYKTISNNELNKFNELKNNLKITINGYGSDFFLYRFIELINTFFIKFLNIEEIINKENIYKNKNNKILFKRIFNNENNFNSINSINNFINKNLNKIIIFTIDSEDKSISSRHISNIVKDINNNYYHNSCNYKTLVSELDIKNNNFQKILDDSKKIGNYTFEFISIFDFYILE